jgi:uncharacterized protein (TIGR02679 family)
VSTTVLCAGLRTLGEDPAALLVRTRADESWATHLTMRDLDVLRWERPPATVSVCENPRVLERAIDSGTDAPIVCTQGNPTLVTRRLLHALVAAGAALRYHGDFDWPGIAIANRIIATSPPDHGVSAPRTYRDAIAHAGSLALELPLLTDRAVAASLDAGLAETMASTVGRSTRNSSSID